MENAAAPYVLFQGVQEDQAVPVFPAVLGLFLCMLGFGLFILLI